MPPTPRPPRRSPAPPLACPRRRAAAAAAVLCFAAPPLAAQGWPGLTASFIAPTGTARATDDIDVWMRLTLAPTAQALTFDRAAGAPDFGLPAGFLPPFASYSVVTTSPYFDCAANTFGGLLAPDAPAVPCRAGAYRFFPHLTETTGRPDFSSRTGFTLLPGESFDYVLGTFRPQHGAAAPGTYSFRNAGAHIALAGADAQGRVLTANVLLAATCASPAGAGCQPFTREVVAAAVVPEPHAAALLGAGALALGGARLRGGRRS